MSPHPTRFTLLVSLMGMGLSVGTQAATEVDPARDDVAQVMRALGLDVPPSEGPAVDPAAVARRLRPTGHAAAAAEQHALLELIRPALVDATIEVAPKEADGLEVVDTHPALPATHVDEPAVPTPPPDTPEGLHSLVGLLGRPIDPDERESLDEAPWTLDWLPPPGPPAAPAEGVNERVNEGRAGLPGRTPSAPSPIDVPAGEVTVAAAPSHVDRVLQNLAGIRGLDGLSTDLPRLQIEVLVAGAETSPSRSAPQESYMHARLADPSESSDVTPTDRVLNALAALRGMPMAEQATLVASLDIEELAETQSLPAMHMASVDDELAGSSPTPQALDDPLASTGTLEAEEAEPSRAPWDGETVAMDSSRLEGVRGGFMTDSGLKLSFGIERAVYINGTLVTTTSLNVADLSQLTAGQAAAAALNGGALAVVQSGTGNTFLPGAVSASALGTVIQNTLDNQNIQNVTTVNATVNSAEILRSLNLQQSVQSAITNALRR